MIVAERSNAYSSGHGTRRRPCDRHMRHAEKGRGAVALHVQTRLSLSPRAAASILPSTFPSFQRP